LPYRIWRVRDFPSEMIMWRSRKKDATHDEDAELRALAKAYSQLHEKKDPSSITSAPAPPTKTYLKDKDKLQQQSSQPSIQPLPELPMDEVIQGSSFSYTRAEAKMYANEEPCDTWRHFDVGPLDCWS
jgi:hypothetical protein